MSTNGTKSPSFCQMCIRTEYGWLHIMEYEEKDIKSVRLFLEKLRKVAVGFGVDEKKVKEIFSMLPKELNELLGENIEELNDENNLEVAIEELLEATELLGKDKVKIVIDFDVIYRTLIEILEKVKLGDIQKSVIRKTIDFIQKLSYVNAVNISKIESINNVNVENFLLKHIRILQEFNMLQLESFYNNANN
jgi:hypothetical protein